MNKFAIEKLSIDDIAKGFKAKKFSSFELVSEYLKKIKKDDTNSFISTNDKAEAEAKNADKILASNSGTELTGIPIAIKDIILVEGLRATAGSNILENYVATYSATAVSKLKEAGMIVLGKTNCDEFAMGSSNENSAYGPVLNPHDKTRVPGGSSGGSAAAVASGLAPVALGTDTGGSIRQPASFCGIYGLKPSYGRVSRYGSIAMASSLDQIGPMGNSIKDLAILLKHIAGFDENDATSHNKKVLDYPNLLDKDVKSLRLGIPKEYFGEGLNEEVRTAIEETIKNLKAEGFEIKEVSLPYTDYALAAYYLLMPAEVSSNLARYDGILYGMASDKNMSLDKWYKEIRSKGFGPESKRRVMLGTYILSAGYYDAYYKQAQKVRTLIKYDFAKVFSEADVLITPATPTTAFKLGEKSQDPLSMYLSDVFTVAANIGGICGLVMPIGSDKNDLPIGLQLLSGSFKEENILKLGNFIEKLTK